MGGGEEVHYNNKQDRGSEKIGVGEEVYYNSEGDRGSEKIGRGRGTCTHNNE